MDIPVKMVKQFSQGFEISVPEPFLGGKVSFNMS